MSTAPALESANNKETDLGQLGQALGAGQNAPTMPPGTTSDLSLDEVLLLHSIGLEPAEVVFGVGCVSIMQGVWTWATGPVGDAHDAFQRALAEAKESIRRQTHTARAIGVLGVDVEIQTSYHRMTVIVTGTAVRSLVDDEGHNHFKVDYHNRAFLCDLSARDFVVLGSAGWYPLDLVAGASYVHAPRRALGTAIGQSTQNVELTNYTQTLYQAREAAMAELQSHITQAGGTGLVDAKIFDRPVHFAHHVVEFVTYGTAIKMLAKEHRHPDISMVVPLDDPVRSFEATSLDNAPGGERASGEADGGD
jgi:uncharacterized protein YbjQ (UPF0145 family)